MEKKLVWAVWSLSLLLLAGFYSYQLFASQDKSVFISGEATHGHHQIELACGSCHTEAFGGQEVMQTACMNCHGAELATVEDSHPQSKFSDPRNADRLQKLDARYCVTCHLEHQQEQTRAMGVTLANDFCFHCHQDIAEDRPSHAGMEFDTCASAGCHNYHDNKALYENFLVKYAHQPVLLEIAQITEKAALTEKYPAAMISVLLTKKDADASADILEANVGHHEQWALDVHAKSGVNCSDCHQRSDNDVAWVDHPNPATCGQCHELEAKTFAQGKHGMRLASLLNPDLKQRLLANIWSDQELLLSPMTPAQGRLPFKPEASHQELNCQSCHAAHDFDLEKAAAESCLGCHNDEHSMAWKASPHYQLWQKEQAGEAPVGSGVSCATCHLPRELHKTAQGERVLVNHNQNAHLRPNEKMIRTVCQSCHGLSFVIDALADRQLINNNFNGQPAFHIESVDMALQRERR